MFLQAFTWPIISRYIMDGSMIFDDGSRSYDDVFKFCAEHYFQEIPF